MATTPSFESAPRFAAMTFAAADASTVKDIMTAGTNGTRIDGILISTNDTTAVNLAFYINDGSADHYIGNVNVPIGSGYTTVARVDGLATLAPAAVLALFLPAGHKLRAGCVATMTAAKLTTVAVVGGDF